MAFRAQLADFAAFYEATYPRAFRTAFAIVRDAESAAELTQQAYVQAFRDRDRFRGDAPADAWLHRIVVHVALSAMRRGSGPRVGAVRWIDPVSEPPGGPVSEAPSGDRLDLLDALGTLDPRHRAAVVLRYYLDHDYATIARILDTSEGNVGSMLSRALARLRVSLDAPGLDGREPGAVASIAEGGRS